jgi:hypothetical protein
MKLGNAVIAKQSLIADSDTNFSMAIIRSVNPV